MDLAKNLSGSFEFAKKLFSDFGRLVILIILDLIPLVNFIVVGYAARVLRESPGVDAPPKLEKYGELFVNGLKIFFATLIYMMLPLIFIAAGVGSFVGSIMMAGSSNFMRGRSGELLMSGTGVVLALIGVILAFVMLILHSAGIAHMIKTGKFSKAFAFSEILNVIGKVGWSKYIAWIILVAIIYAIIGLVSSIPIVGWLISLIVAPVLATFIYRSLGLLYADGTQ